MHAKPVRPSRRPHLPALVSCCVLLFAGASGPLLGLALPNRQDSVKFGVIGDSGSGDQAERDVAGAMAAAHATFPFELVIMLGDNIYGRQDAQALTEKFEQPFRPLLEKGVRFYATLGNHDSPAQASYPPFNMGGQPYYTFARRHVRFVALDSNAMDSKQLAWVERTLTDAHEDWKIVYFHHPLYSDGRRHGSSVQLRVLLEPLFVKTGVNVVFSGHDHVYEHIRPQRGITYFVSGAGGQLRKGDVKASAMTAAAFDADQSFMLVEVAGDDLFFEAVSRRSVVVDSGVVRREKPSMGSK